MDSGPRIQVPGCSQTRWIQVLRSGACVTPQNNWRSLCFLCKSWKAQVGHSKNTIYRSSSSLDNEHLERTSGTTCEACHATGRSQLPVSDTLTQLEVYRLTSERMTSPWQTQKQICMLSRVVQLYCVLLPPLTACVVLCIVATIDSKTPISNKWSGT